MALKDFAEEDDVLISDRIADLLHSAVIVLKQAFGGGDAEFLQVSQRSISGCLLEAANEIAQAHSGPFGRGLERE